MADRQEQAGSGTGPGGVAAAVIALAGGKTQAEAAALAGVAERTIRSWAARPAFRRKVSRARDQVISEGVGRLVALLAKADQAIAELLDDDNPRVRLDAAKAVREALTRGREQVELADRLALVEDRVRRAEKGAQSWTG